MARNSLGFHCFPSLVFCRKSKRLAALALAVVLHMAAESPRRGEFAELVPDHRLSDKHRDVLASVVYGDRVPEHVGNDHRTAGPRLDDVFGALFVLSSDLNKQVLIDEGAFLQAAWHVSRLLSLV